VGDCGRFASARPYLSSTGTLSGVPQTGGYYSFQVALSDQMGSAAFQIVTAQFASQLSLINPALQEGVLGQSMHLPSVTGGGAPYQWAVQSGALPPGLALNSNGTVNGLYTTPGTFSFTLIVTDATGVTLTIPVQQQVIVSSPILAGNLPTLRQGLEYLFPIVITGGLPPFHFLIDTLGILQVDSTGIVSISGPQLVPGGESEVPLVFSDGRGIITNTSVGLNYARPGTLVDGTNVTTLSQSPFVFYLPQPSGNPPFAWSAQLPAGVSLDPTDGVLQGNIDQPASLVFPVTSSNGSGQQVTTTYTLTISPNSPF
jgi:hypothetical protein